MKLNKKKIEINKNDKKVKENIENFDKPDKVFRRRLAMGENSAKIKDFHKEDEDKSYMNLKYKTSSTYLVDNKTSYPITSHLQDYDLPKFGLSKTSKNWNNGDKLSKIIK
mmetsp:Transcript_10040/g.8839  ORF Transcript_10040/g.8839 Transcript_10040/m.8839 type:complete len:110 (+) Transcript_10040:287-616(+)